MMVEQRPKYQAAEAKRKRTTVLAKLRQRMVSGGRVVPWQMKLALALLIASTLACGAAERARFIPLTRPDGATTYVLPGMVIDVYPAGPECGRGAKTQMLTLAGTLCVRETPAEAVDKMKDGLS